MTTRTKTTETSVVLPDVGRRLAVLSDGSSVSVVGTEGAARIRFEAQGGTARLVSSGTGGDVVVAEGTTAQIVDMFASLRAQAQPRRRVGIGTAAAAAVAAVLLGGGFLATQIRPSSPPAFDAVALQNALKASGAMRPPTQAATAPEAAPKTAARSVAIPDELPSLDAPPELPVPVRVAPAAPEATRPPAAAQAQPAKQPEPQMPASKPDAQTRTAGATPDADKAVTAVAALAKPPAAAAPQAEPVKRAETEAAPKLSGPEAIMAAIGRMNPIEAAQAVKALDQIKTSLADTGEIPPEVLREIPHEIAKALRDAGVNLTAGERREAGRKVSAVVRLPETAIEGFRGRDGIASIPDSNSWVLTEGNVRLPLPGGGDIRTVDNMKEFGLQP
ncbi:hypothetical protein [Methylorubrum extorquens]|nr:hypothetical protein [Methylorubrum extorquens]MCP1545983.1 outer membrane biosynthesis protein TonB [Methylorubrum extorquens]MCP1590650.1 outer membrane biosynthesis protein TonB [Methylorubrum extorquens]